MGPSQALNTARSDLPRERLWAQGAQALTAPELLAILLGTGGRGKSALELADELLDPVDGSLRRLAARPPRERRRGPRGGPATGAGGAARRRAAPVARGRTSQGCAAARRT